MEYSVVAVLKPTYLFSTFEIPAVQLVGATPPDGTSPRRSSQLKRRNFDLMVLNKYKPTMVQKYL